MKKLLFSLISLSLGIILLFWLVQKIGWRNIKDTILQLSFWELIFVLFLGFLCLLFGTLRWREILRQKGYQFSIAELYGEYLASFAITYLVPLVFFGNEVFRSQVLTLKRKDALLPEKTLSAAIIDRIFETGFQTTTIFLGVLSLFLITGSLLMSFVVIVFLFFLILLFYYFFFFKKSFIGGFLRLDKNNHFRLIEKEIFAFFKIRNRFFQRALLFSFLKTTLNLLQYWILIYFLGSKLSFLEAVSVLGISILSMAPPISADFGSHDWGSALLCSKLGLGMERGVAFASIVRGINLILATLGILFLIKIGFFAFLQKILKKINKLLSIKR